MIVAAIDVGTNSVRVYVAERDGALVRSIERDLVITRLGQGVDHERRLAGDAIVRTTDAIARYAERARTLGAGAIRIAATSAVRDAKNRDEFLDRVRQATGTDVEVLSGEQEATLSFSGAVAELRNRTGPFCVLDIGGGSTEVAVGESEIEAWASLDIGSVRLTERCVEHDPILPEELDAIAVIADGMLEQLADRVDPKRANALVGVAGTITTIAAVRLGLPGYDRDAIHHATLTETDIDDAVAQLVALTSYERRRLPAMPRGREDVIVAGAVILQCFMRRFGFERVLVSESDILDGLVAEIG